MASSPRNCNGEYESYDQSFFMVLNMHAPQKFKVFSGNHKPSYDKNLRKTIVIKRSSLKNKTNRSKDPVDIDNYKKQRNLVVSLNRKAKSEYFNDVLNFESSRTSLFDDNKNNFILSISITYISETERFSTSPFQSDV